MKWVLLLVCLWVPSFVTANDPAARAIEAKAALQAAADQLAQAEGARDRIRALTAVVHAFEDGLAAMREGLRGARDTETQIRRSLAQRQASIEDLITTLLVTRPDTQADAFLHPGGVKNAARASMLVTTLAPAIHDETQGLRRDLETAQALSALQGDLTQQLERSLSDVQAARVALGQAMSDRTRLPSRFVDDPVRLGLLISTADTLDTFAAGLSQSEGTDVAWVARNFETRIGALPLPARGVILRRASEPDAAGIVRPGIVVATRPGSIVTSPATATLRYAGPLLDLGNVIVLEPQPQTLIILGGLETIYGTTGEIVTEGTPLGLMPVQAEISRSTPSDRAGLGLTETLYIEVRHKNIPEDPENWFRTEKDD